MADPHATLDPWEARQQGCTCEFGCRNCGYDLSQMGNCAAWNPCPVGREPSDGCPLSGDEKDCTCGLTIGNGVAEDPRCPTHGLSGDE